MSLLTTAIGSLITALIKNLPEGWLVDLWAEWSASIRKKIVDSPNTIDDLVVLPILDAIDAQAGLNRDNG